MLGAQVFSLAALPWKHFAFAMPCGLLQGVVFVLISFLGVVYLPSGFNSLQPSVLTRTALLGANNDTSH